MAMKIDYDQDRDDPAEIDDAEWDRYQKMSDSEIEAEWQQELAKYVAMRKRMTMRQEIAYDRDSALRSIRQNRRRIKKHKADHMPQCLLDVFEQGIARNRLRLVKLRIWRASGVYPGEG